jgi:hypothetical protein
MNALPPRILVVDDDPGMLDTLSDVFLRLECHSGCQPGRLRLPDQAGRYGPPPAGRDQNAIVHHGVLEPGMPFLQKPFTRGTLARKIRQVFDQV